MKKLMVALVALLLLTTAACAECTTVYLPQSATMTLTSTSITLTGDAPIILTENHKLPGIKTLSEVSYVLPYNAFNGYTYLTGIVDNQLIREVGLQFVHECGDGFSLLQGVTIEIFNEYVDEVQSIILERVGTDELSINSFFAATLWRVGNRAGYIFYTSYSARVQIGKMITKWGWVPVYKGDINEDGHYEIGFPPGINNYVVVNTNTNTNTNTTVIVDTNTVVVDNTTDNTTINVATNTNTTTTGCGSTVTNVNVTGNGNITTTTAATTTVKGDNNNTTVVNNNSNTNMYALIGIVVNNDSNNTIVNTNSGEQEICKPSLFIDKTQRNPNSGCG